MSLATSTLARLRAAGRPAWPSSPTVLRTEVLADLVVGLALIPEAISFSVIAGADPKVGLFAACTMAMVIAFAGGRPAMISASTGAVALVVAPVARQHGLGHLIATVILAGVFQIILGALGVAKLMRFVPRSVMVGFVNALGILLFTAQIPNLHHVPWPVYPLVAAGIAVPTVGDKGRLPSSLPVPGLPDVPFTAHTLTLIAPYAFPMALVGPMETLMTAELVDDLTDTRPDKTAMVIFARRIAHLADVTAVTDPDGTQAVYSRVSPVAIGGLDRPRRGKGEAAGRKGWDHGRGWQAHADRRGRRADRAVAAHHPA
ncbi:hypothetical protein Airi02_008990 [Actinoallomurus iriomotensis]|uniref:SLC26A/SulP transporter domain-containing protein n=1 Tax=Actinoallomurus iriomotensis TaxID=478107 RepID=A0A9W6RW89_9ACTN|nr:hypothetical protein Airi02_008990 [Actinoallomurus iriomotensis]